MNVRAKTVLSLSVALPVVALAAFLLIQPQKLSAQQAIFCYYNGQRSSLGATSQNGCAGGQAQTCYDGGNGTGVWSPCTKQAELQPVDPQQ